MANLRTGFYGSGKANAAAGVVTFGVGFSAATLRYWVRNPAARDLLRLRAKAALYLYLTHKDYLPTSKQAEAGRALERDCAVGL